MILFYIVFLLLILINQNKLLSNTCMALLVSLSIYQNSNDNFILFFASAAGLVTFLSSYVFNKSVVVEKTEGKKSKIQQSLIVVVLVLISALLSLAFSKIKVNSTITTLNDEDILSSLEYILIIFALFMISRPKKRKVYE